MAAQNRWRSSRRATEGRPGEGKAPRPDRSERRLPTLIATSSLKVLRRPLEPAKAGWVGVGQDHDTAAFAGQTIRRWWQEIGRPRYPGAKSLTITADGGGSNGVRVRLWERELQRLADESGLAITVHHLPPGTSKGSAIEHRLFAFISQNSRATPLVSYRVIVDLVGATTTRAGLSVRCELDPNRTPKGVTVSDAEPATPAPNHGQPP